MLSGKNPQICRCPLVICMAAAETSLHLTFRLTRFSPTITLPLPMSSTTSPSLLYPQLLHVFCFLCQPRGEIRSLASFCKSNAESKEEFIRGQGTRRTVTSELLPSHQPFSLLPFSLISQRSQPSPSGVCRINTPDTDVYIISNISLFRILIEP